MKIEVCWLSIKYADVTVRASNTVLELGLYNDAERKQLADHLREVAENLSPVEQADDH